MGQFANALFSVLLGWVEGVASGLWALLTNADISAWSRWVMDNWLPLTLLLCVAGAVVDFLVYLIRWQPYRVWGGLLRRLMGQKAQEEETENQEQDERFQRTWVYADGTTLVEDIRKTTPETTRQLGTERLEMPIRPVKRAPVSTAQEKAYYQPVYPPQWQQATKDNSGGNE